MLCFLLLFLSPICYYGFIDKALLIAKIFHKFSKRKKCQKETESCLHDEVINQNDRTTEIKVPRDYQKIKMPSILIIEQL